MPKKRARFEETRSQDVTAKPAGDGTDNETRRRRLSQPSSLEETIRLIDKSNNILVLCGAGISVSCGVKRTTSLTAIILLIIYYYLFYLEFRRVISHPQFLSVLYCITSSTPFDPSSQVPDFRSSDGVYAIANSMGLNLSDPQVC